MKRELRVGIDGFRFVEKRWGPEREGAPASSWTLVGDGGVPVPSTVLGALT